MKIRITIFLFFSVFACAKAQIVDTGYHDIRLPYFIKNDTVIQKHYVYDTTFSHTTVYDTNVVQVTVLDSTHSTLNVRYDKPKYDYTLYAEYFRDKVDFYEGQGDWDTQTLELVMDSLRKVRHHKVNFCTARGKWAVIRNIELPLEQSNGQYVFDGCGMDFVLAPGISGFVRTPETNYQANYRIGETFHFKNFTFRGGGIGVDLGASYLSTIRECKFYGQSDISLKLSFALGTLVEGCEFAGFQNWALSVQNGEWDGAGVTNSQSNHTIVRRCRFYCGQGSDIAAAVLNSSGVRFEDCIIEGEDPNHAIYFDSDLSSPVKYFEVKNLHLENKPKKSAFLLQSQGGNMVFDGIFMQHPAKLFHLAGPKTQTLRISNFPWVPEGTSNIMDNTASKYVSVEGSHLAFSSKDVWGGERPYYFDMKGSDQFTGKVWGKKQFYNGIIVNQSLDVPTYLTNAFNQKLGFGIENGERKLYWLYDNKTAKTTH